jgi:predicted alpha-1,6-mannanase (GH76 family)
MRKVVVLLGLLLLLAAKAAAPALTAPDPDAMMRSFLDAYWDAKKGYFLAWERTAPFKRPAAAGPEGGTYSDFWWEAQLWDLVLDAANRDPNNAGYRKLVDDVYDGFVREYPDFLNDFNDDLGWWAQASMRAYMLTNNARYLERAKGLFEDIWKYWTPSQGGGITWRRSTQTQKNVATNGPLTVIAVRLYQATRDASYLERARQIYAWMDESLTNGDDRVFDNFENGELRRWDFTYNVGNFVLASLAIREVSSDDAEKARLLSRAQRSMDWALENLTNAGIFLDEGGGDGGGFKGVTMRGLRRLADAPGLEAAAKTKYDTALRDMATQVWNVRRADGLVGTDWAVPQERGVIESLAAGSAVTALQLAPGPLEARVPTGDGRFEAENSAREGVNPSVNAPGFSGRAYINNFFKDGQFVEFRVNVPEGKAYTFKWRYSAGGGDAPRRVSVGEGDAQTVDFKATPNWMTWAELETQVTLAAGSNRVKVYFDRARGSRGYLNLDRVLVGAP